MNTLPPKLDDAELVVPGAETDADFCAAVRPAEPGRRVFRLTPAGGRPVELGVQVLSEGRYGRVSRGEPSDAEVLAAIRAAAVAAGLIEEPRRENDANQGHWLDRWEETR